MLFLLFCCAISVLSCQNPSGSEVDWFTMFKVPKIKDRIPSHVNGMGFFYQDPSIKLAEAPSDVGATVGNPLYNILQPVYKNSSQIGYVMISDQPPHTTHTPSDIYAHKKGVLVYDSDNGIYLEHSVPRFPNDPNVEKNYEYPHSGTTYGQSFLCVTLTHAQINEWAHGMLIERGYVYSHKTPSFTKKKIANLIKVINGQWLDKHEMTKVIEIQSLTRKFKLISKSRLWGKDLYHDLVAPELQGDVKAETWAKGPGTMTSNCSRPYKAYNILDVQFGYVKWSRMHDHSKWAVADDYVCIGGINRQRKQTERGGGTWCMYDKKFAASMNDVAISYEKCP